MYIRVFHARVKPGKQAEFKKTLELLAFPNIQYRNGMVAFYPGQPLGAHSNEFVLVTVWKDASGVENLSSSDWAKAIVPPEALPLLEEWKESGYKTFGVVDPQVPPLFNSI